MDDTGSRIGLYISIINRAALGFFYQRLKKFDIGPGQQAYLLSIIPGEFIVQERLAHRLKVDKANVTRALKGLEKSGYIKRTPSSGDKRSWEIRLTQRGIKIRGKIETIAQEWINRLKEPLSSEDWNALESHLQIIAESL